MAPFAIVLGILVAGCTDSASANDKPHGDPDPGGRRIAYITQIARQAVPAGATAIYTTVAKSHWDPGGCDGGAAGWSRMEIHQHFQAPTGATSSRVDALMLAQHWDSVPLKGGTAVREYAYPTPRSDDGYAWLFSSPDTAAHATSWELDVSAAPAEVPTHSC